MLINRSFGLYNNGYQLSLDNGGSNGSSNVFNSFQINATPVAAVPFEFNPALGLGAIGGFYLVRKRLKKNLKKKSTKV
jgi:hypothetical protein